MNECPDVLILGGGIGGLSTAHCLRHLGFDGSITILEANDQVGGEARSANIPGTATEGRQDLPTEHCWRIYGAGYTHLFQIMKQIPLIEGEGGTVFDHLVALEHFFSAPAHGKVRLFDQSAKGFWNYTQTARQGMTARQKWKLLNKVLYAATCSKRRLSEELADQTWSEFLSPPTQAGVNYFVRAFGPFFGVDCYKTSASSVWEILENTGGPVSKYYATPGNTMVMNGPTSEVWFRHWHSYLSDRNVKILTQERVMHLHLDSTFSHILGVQSRNEKTGQETKWNSPWVVCALPIKVASRLLSATSISRQLHLLAPRGEQHMVGVQLYFGEKLKLKHNSLALYLPDSPWQLIIEPQGFLWDAQIEKQYGDKSIHDIWSVGICDPEQPGTSTGRRYMECSRHEVEEEVWLQIIATESLSSLVEPESGIALAHLKPVRIHLWDACVDVVGGGLFTSEPKTSPNSGTWKLRPSVTCDVDNLLFATSYTKGSREMILMDAAAEAGSNAARQILGITTPNFPVRKRSNRVLFGPLRLLDDSLMRWKRPHLSTILGGQSSLVFLSYVALVLVIAVLVLVKGLRLLCRK